MYDMLSHEKQMKKKDQQRRKKMMHISLYVMDTVYWLKLELAYSKF
jgi:hypothetical protein